MFFIQQQENERGEAEDGTFDFTDNDKNQAMKHRLRKDMAALDLPQEVTLEITKKTDGEEDLQNFTITLRPDEESYWNGGVYPFKFEVPDNFPYEPPIVTCQTKIWHPNINLSGNVCLNILRKDWKPVLSINHVVFGLETLFLSPNPTDPLNKGKYYFLFFRGCQADGQ